MMKLRGTLVLAFFAVSCGSGGGPSLTATDIIVTRPLPGTSMSAGYFTLENHGGSTVVITDVDSPQFANVEMHETVIENDVSRMRMIDELRIGPGERVRFDPGGRHLMLMRPGESLQGVTLNFFAGETLLLSVSADATDP